MTRAQASVLTKPAERQQFLIPLQCRRWKHEGPEHRSHHLHNTQQRTRTQRNNQSVPCSRLLNSKRYNNVLVASD
jgi:hypothetical protein